jgi:hypothetical protein
MMVMTAKVDLKKIILAVAAAVALILAAILLLGGESEQTVSTAAPSLSANEGRVQFLKNFGWDVTTSPMESGQVKIPKDSSEVFDRYNVLQNGQGYDLSAYAGKNVMRYVYQVNNYPGASAPVYATLLIHKNQVIGGDVTDTSPGGKIRGFKMPEPAATAPIAPTATTESTATEP